MLLGLGAAGHTVGNQGVKWRITVKNTTDEPFNGAIFIVNVKAGPDGEQVENVFDSAQNLSGGFEGSVSLGRSATTEFGFDVPKNLLIQLDLEVQPGFEYERAHWVGSAD